MIRLKNLHRTSTEPNHRMPNHRIGPSLDEDSRVVKVSGSRGSGDNALTPPGPAKVPLAPPSIVALSKRGLVVLVFRPDLGRDRRS